MSIQIHCATTNTCNGRCSFCPYVSPENTRPKGFMTMELFRKIADEAATIPQLSSWAFSALGEPLLDKHLAERVSYTQQLRPGWPTELYTNGVYLTPEKFEALKAAGLNTLSVSLNAVSQEQHEKIMGIKGKFQTVVDNIRYAQKSGGVNLLVKAVRNDDSFDSDSQMKFYLTWGIKHHPEIKEGIGQVVVERDWAGANRRIDGFDPYGTFDENACCNRAVEQLSILYDGTVTLCCYDPFAKHNLGNLKTQSIREVYNGTWYTQFRQDHFDNKAAKYEICKGCTRV